MIWASNYCICKCIYNQQPLLCRFLFTLVWSVGQHCALANAEYCLLSVCEADRIRNSLTLFSWVFLVSISLQIFMLTLIMNALDFSWQSHVFLPSVGLCPLPQRRQTQPVLSSWTARWIICKDVSIDDLQQKSRKCMSRENLSNWRELNLHSSYNRN